MDRNVHDVVLKMVPTVSLLNGPIVLMVEEKVDLTESLSLSFTDERGTVGGFQVGVRGVRLVSGSP